MLNQGLQNNNKKFDQPTLFAGFDFVPGLAAKKVILIKRKE